MGLSGGLHSIYTPGRGAWDILWVLETQTSEFPHVTMVGVYSGPCITLNSSLTTVFCMVVAFIVKNDVRQGRVLYPNYLHALLMYNCSSGHFWESEVCQIVVKL